MPHKNVDVVRPKNSLLLLSKRTAAMLVMYHQVSWYFIQKSGSEITCIVSVVTGNEGKTWWFQLVLCFRGK